MNLEQRVREATTASEARDVAIDWQQYAGDVALSWSELADAQADLENLVDRFPELEAEFRENGII